MEVNSHGQAVDQRGVERLVLTGLDQRIPASMQQGAEQHRCYHRPAQTHTQGSE
jgi:hypothetical protein